MSLCQLTSFPSLAHYSLAQTSATSSGRGFLGLRTTSTLTPKTFPLPTSCPPPPVSGFDPQVRKALKALARRLQQSSLMPSSSGTLALCTLALSTKPSVSRSKWRFLPSTFYGGVEAAALCASHSRGPGRV